MSHKRIKLSLAALATAFFLAGCAGGSKPVADSDLATGEPRPLPFSQGTLSRQAAPLDTTPLQISELKDDESTAPLRQESLPGRTSSNGGEQGLVSKYPDNLIKGLPDPGTKIKLGLTFNAAELSEVVAAFAAPSMLNFGYIIDPAVKGAVTLAVDTEMTAAQAWETFEHILWLSGAYASMNTGFIHILPFTKMPQERRIFADHEIQPNVVVDFIPIRYKVSANIINQLKPFLTEGATATDVADSNTVVLIEAPANIEKLRELISHLDSKGERDWPCASFQCRDVEADELAAELTQLLPVLGFPVAAGSGSSGGAVKLVALPRIGCVVVSAALPEVVQEVGKWVKALDRSDMMHREEIFFYNSTHTTASKLADAICAFFNAEVSSSSSGLSSGSTSSSGGSFSSGFNSSNRSTSMNRNNSSSRNRSNTGTRSTGSSRNNSNNRRTTTTASNARSTTSTAARTMAGNSNLNQNYQGTSNSSVFDNEVTVFVDEESNRLTVKTSPKTWAVVEAFLKRHDVPARQVSIKAIITEISLDKSTEFGVTYAASKMFSHNNWVGSGAWAGAGAANGLLNPAAGENPLNKLLNNWNNKGLGLVLQEGTDPLAFVTAVAGEGRTKILSEPHLIVVSGAEAYLQSGQEIAVPTETTNYTNSSGNTSTNYEYKDIGVIMTVTPYITAGNDVRLVIEQEVSALEASSASDNSNAPNFSTKRVSTEMTVKDNSTFMMGGMIKNSESVVRSGIPYLRDIPYLGLLFGWDNRTSIRTELLILITVNVIDNDNFQDELIRRYKESLEEIQRSQNAETY